MEKKIMIATLLLMGGGAERVATIWANELAQRGYETFMLALYPIENEYYISDRVKKIYVTDTQDEYLALSFSSRIKRIRKHLKEVKPNHIISLLQTMQLLMLYASIGLRSKRIETIRNNPWKNGVDGRVREIMWKMCFHTAHRIVLQATDQAPFLSKRDRKKSVLIPNPISELYVENYKEETEEKPVSFVAVGRINSQKNYEMMLRGFADACKKHPEITLNIFGTGTDGNVEKVAGLITDLKMDGNVTMMGLCPHMEQEYRKYDVFLMTSDYEGLPNALMEAMASRLVCISTNCKTGPGDLIENGINGFLIDVGSAEQLSECIDQVCELDYEKRKEIADAARKKILTEYSKKNSVDKLCEILQ